MRPNKDEYAEYYETYIRLVPDGNIVDTLSRQIEETLNLIGNIDEAKALFRYADGKWSIKEVIGHLVDSERMFAYRAMCFARDDSTPLPAFDQNEYVKNGNFDGRNLNELADEFRSLRQSNIALFGSFDDNTMAKWGTASGFRFTVRALVYIIAGHELHHRNILKERYGL